MDSRHASFYHQTRAARRIVVVDLGFLGDAVHTLPALWEIKRHYPQAQLHAVWAPVGCEVLRLADCVDRTWSFPLDPQSPAWWRHWDIILALRRQGFDLAFNFSGADRTLFLTALTGAKWRLAHQGGRRHFWNSWLIANWVPRQSTHLPVFEQRRQVLAASGLALEPAQFNLRIPAADTQWAAGTVPRNALHFSINASTPQKEWPLGHWIELARILLHEDSALNVVASGSARAREQERLTQFAAALHHPRLTTLPPNLTIAQLSATLCRCRLHVGGDSGVVHLAMALDIPTLSIIREYPGAGEWLPRGAGHRHLAAPRLASIAPDTVAEELRRFKAGA